MVVILVETQRSMTDIYETSLSDARRRALGLVASDHEARAATLGHPSFAAGPTNSAMDHDVQECGLEKDIQLEVNLIVGLPLVADWYRHLLALQLYE